MSRADHPFHGAIHHLGYVVADLEATVQRLVSQHAAYVVAPERLAEAREDAGVDWDGSDPLRPLD